MAVPSSSSAAIGKSAAYTAGTAAAGSGAHVDFFIKIDSIEGESEDAKHAKEIEVHSWSWGESQPGTFAMGGGGGAGKVAMNDLTFMCTTGKASPKLMAACATGQHIKEATLTARKAGGGQQDYFTIKLSDVMVSTYQIAGSSEVPIDSVSLNFAKIEVEYKPQKKDGGLDSPVKFGYDLKKATKL